MSNDATQVTVAGDGHIYTAIHLDAGFPANISAPVVPASGWVDHGFTTPDGVHMTFDRQTKDLFAWQIREAVRTIITSKPSKVDAVLMQWNSANFLLGAGGGSIASGVYTPPAASFVDERAMIVETIDGDYTYRFCYKRVINKAPFDFMARADDSSNIPISMSVLAPSDGSASWYVQTNDPDFADAVDGS